MCSEDKMIIPLHFVSGDMTELIKILAMIIGGFFGILFLIIILTLLYRRLKNRRV